MIYSCISSFSKHPSSIDSDTRTITSAEGSMQKPILPKETRTSKTFLHGFHFIFIAILTFFLRMIGLQNHMIEILFSYE